MNKKSYIFGEIFVTVLSSQTEPHPCLTQRFNIFKKRSVVSNPRLRIQSLDIFESHGHITIPLNGVSMSLELQLIVDLRLKFKRRKLSDINHQQASIIFQQLNVK